MLKGIGKALEQADIDIYLIVDGIYREGSSARRLFKASITLRWAACVLKGARTNSCRHAQTENVAFSEPQPVFRLHGGLATHVIYTTATLGPNRPYSEDFLHASLRVGR
ncbi:MAG: hypothetical protein ABJZ69_01345, partial [Hyphomicrobiales bacterium]